MHNDYGALCEAIAWMFERMLYIGSTRSEFDRFDADHDGTIGLVGFTKCPHSKRETEDGSELADKNADSVLTQDEFENAGPPRKNGDSGALF